MDSGKCYCLVFLISICWKKGPGFLRLYTEEVRHLRYNDFVWSYFPALLLEKIEDNNFQQRASRSAAWEEGRAGWGAMPLAGTGIWEWTIYPEQSALSSHLPHPFLPSSKAAVKCCHRGSKEGFTVRYEIFYLMQTEQKTLRLEQRKGLWIYFLSLLIKQSFILISALHAWV